MFNEMTIVPNSIAWYEMSMSGPALDPVSHLLWSRKRRGPHFLLLVVLNALIRPALKGKKFAFLATSERFV